MFQFVCLSRLIGLFIAPVCLGISKHCYLSGVPPHLTIHEHFKRQHLQSHSDSPASTNYDLKADCTQIRPDHLTAMCAKCVRECANKRTTVCSFKDDEQSVQLPCH